MTLSLTFHSDAGHGWLEVPNSLYKQAGINASRFSYYSVKKDCVYLEEDCDANLFIDAMEKQGFKIEFGDNYCNGLSPIRKLSRMPGY